jgi:predicted GNAT family N-acyltransferase
VRKKKEKPVIEMGTMTLFGAKHLIKIYQSMGFKVLCQPYEAEDTRWVWRMHPPDGWNVPERLIVDRV